MFLGIVFLLVVPPLGVLLIVAGVAMMATSPFQMNKMKCLDCKHMWRYPSRPAPRLHPTRPHKGHKQHPTRPQEGHKQHPTRSFVGHKPRPIGPVVLIACGVLFGLFALLMGFGLIAERQGKADLARADGLWHEGKQAEAVSIYMSEMLYVDDARKPEVFSRIITQLYESGNTEGATDYYNKALDDDLHIEFANGDLQRYFDDMRKAMDAPITTEVTVEAQSMAPSDGAGSSHPKLEQAPLVQGMTYAEVCAAIGWDGTERGSLGGPNGSKTTAYKWDDEEGSIVASFQDDALDKWDYNKRAIRTVADENQQTQALVQARLSDYSTTLDAAGVSIVRNINVKLDGDMWTVTLKVDDVWHYRPYQVRLQDTQTFWQVWAQIASPNDPDKARISIRDLNGNEVGGSRVLAGSLIWVQD